MHRYNPDTRTYIIPIKEICEIVDKIPVEKRQGNLDHVFTIYSMDPEKVMNVTDELYNTWLGQMSVANQSAMLRKYSLRNVGAYVKMPNRPMEYIPQTTIDEEVENDEELENLVGGMVKDSDFIIEVDHISKEEFREAEHQDIMDEWSRLQKSD